MNLPEPLVENAAFVKQDQYPAADHSQGSARYFQK